jgi:hypothetical protein
MDRARVTGLPRRLVLQHVIERASLLSTGAELALDDWFRALESPLPTREDRHMLELRQNCGLAG